MTKWEYRKQDLEPVNKDRHMVMEIPGRILDVAGNHGWELVTIDFSSNVAYFKRPILPIVTRISSAGPKEAVHGKEEAEIEEEKQEDEEDEDKQEIYSQRGEIFHRTYREDL